MEQPQCANRIGFLIFPFNRLKSSHALLKEAQSLPPPLELSKPQGLANLAHRVVSLYWTCWGGKWSMGNLLVMRFLTGPCVTWKASFCTTLGRGFSSGPIMVAPGLRDSWLTLTCSNVFQGWSCQQHHCWRAGFKVLPFSSLEHWFCFLRSYPFPWGRAPSFSDPQKA